MSEKKPHPYLVQPMGKICPVCRTRTYSHGGIHPQCAVRRADSARADKLKAERKRGASTAKASSWTQKKCPRCGSQSHVRRKTCDCGHLFF